MTDRLTPETRSRNMAAIRGTNTKPELAVRGFLHAKGFRFRLHRNDLPGKPDIVLPKFRTVIFVHGCFWHLHGCKNTVAPKTRSEWWAAKLEGNRTEAHLRVSVALSESLEKCSKETFLRGWWAFCWLNPGFHPDDFRQWDDPNGQHFATEAFRRCEAGEIEDDLVYAAEATHNAVWLERRGDLSASLAFKDGYTPQYPELIPANEAEAESRLNAIQVRDIQQCPKDIFLEGWWALFWLNPELNPDYFDEWESESWRTLAEEAFRRFETGEICDQETYPCESCHSRFLGEKATGRTTFGREPFDRRVVIRTDDGQYISRDSGATPDKAKAARYYMIADRVADQIAAVKKLYGRIMTTEDGKWL